VDVVVALELARGLDALPGRGNLDEDALAVDSDALVEGNQLLGLCDGSFLVEGQPGIDFGRDPARDQREDLFAELGELQSLRQRCTENLRPRSRGGLSSARPARRRCRPGPLRT
jgi:hypothetical protein